MARPPGQHAILLAMGLLDKARAPGDAPVLVLGSGQRCGSTLIQRLLSSHKGVMIWGEHGGHLRDLLGMTSTLKLWDRYVSSPARRDFEKGGHSSWMANLLPGQEAVVAAARAHLVALFGEPAAAMGRPRWGFKEVRFGFSEAEALRELFPALTVVHVTRDPRDMLVSLDSWERSPDTEWPRSYTEAAVAAWASINASFRDAGPPDWVLSRRYEDIVADPAAFTADLARLLHTKPERFDSGVFGHRIVGADGGSRPDLRGWAELPGDLRALLDSEHVRTTAEAYGYRLG